MKIKVSKLKVGNQVIESNFMNEDFLLKVISVLHAKNENEMTVVELENEEGDVLVRHLFSDQLIEISL